MKLLGQLDSPYVRRVAISLYLQNLPFEHVPLSVFSTFNQFAEVNPVVKAPTLVTDEGVVLMESSLILEYADLIADPEVRLTCVRRQDRVSALRVVGLALMACEKAVQFVYECKLRPREKRHAPWLERVDGQLQTAFVLLEHEFESAQGWRFGGRPHQADVSTAVAFRFALEAVPNIFDPCKYPALAALSKRAEATKAFQTYQFDSEATIQAPA